MTELSDETRTPGAVRAQPPPAPARAARPRRRWRSRLPRVGERKVAYLFLAPWFLGLGLITLGPIFGSLYLSFTDYSLIESPSWTGLANYTRMLHDVRLHHAHGVGHFTTACDRPLPRAPSETRVTPTRWAPFALIPKAGSHQ